jgi:competence protein ComEA
MLSYKTAVLKSRFALVTVALFTAICINGSFAQTTNATKPATMVDVNSADAKTLQTLPGVGSTTAKKIIGGRPYKSISDLSKIKGLTDAKLSLIKDRLVFGPAVAAAATNTATVTKIKTSATTTATNTTAAPKPKSTAAATLAPGQMININTASAVDLDKVPGIGPTKAQAIVDYRTQNGNFKSIEDIQKVKGIKAGTFAKIKDYIKVSD